MITISQDNFYALVRENKHIDFAKNHDRVIVDGNVYFDMYYINDVSELPDNLTITEGLNISKTKIKKIPRNLVIRNEISLPYPMYFPPETMCSFVRDDLDWNYYTLKEYKEKYNYLFLKRIYFLRKKIICLKNLIEIPELFQEIYYSRKSDFLSLLSKV